MKVELKIPKVHDLTFLAKKAGVSEELLPKCEVLSIVYVETRYPDTLHEAPFKRFNKEISEEHLKIAAEILRWVEKNI